MINLSIKGEISIRFSPLIALLAYTKFAASAFFYFTIETNVGPCGLLLLQEDQVLKKKEEE